MVKMLKNFWMMVWLTVFSFPAMTTPFTSPPMEMLLFSEEEDFESGFMLAFWRGYPHYPLIIRHGLSILEMYIRFWLGSIHK
jgi:hypothetical protein